MPFESPSSAALVTFSIGRGLLPPDSKNMTWVQKAKIGHGSPKRSQCTWGITQFGWGSFSGFQQPNHHSSISNWRPQELPSCVRLPGPSYTLTIGFSCFHTGHSIDARFQLRILAAKGRWWQIQEILLTLSVTNVKKAGREDHHTSVHNGLKLDLCCVCHENLTSIRLHQHEVLHPSPNLL